MNELISTKLKIFIIPHPPDFNYLWSCPRGSHIVKTGLEELDWRDIIELVEEKERADIYILDYVPHLNGQKYNKDFIKEYVGKKLVVIDWTDEAQNYLVDKDEYLIYFKRSWFSALNQQGIRVEIQHPSNFYPFSYSVLPNYNKFGLPNWHKRFIDIGCYLRNEQPNRSYILQVMNQIKQQLPHLNIRVGPVSNGSRSVGKEVYTDETYFNILGQTKVLVTANPPLFGDSRFWEGLNMCCTVISDNEKLNIPWPLENEKHFKEYNFRDINILVGQIQDCINNPVNAFNIAWTGYNYASTFHDPRTRMDYVINTVKKIL